MGEQYKRVATLVEIEPQRLKPLEAIAIRRA
jgi:hypothetical protein